MLRASALVALLLLAGCAEPTSDPIEAATGDDGIPTLAVLQVDPAGPVKGDPEAPIQIIAYEAPACAACKRLHDNGYPTIFERFVDPGHAAWYHQSWTIGHGYDDRAGLALECTYDRGGSDAYWDFQDRVYSYDYPNYSGMDDDEVRAELAALAERHSLDASDLVSCYDDEEFADEMQEDIEAGSEHGARWSPSFIVRGPGFFKAVMARDLEPTLNDALAAIEG